MQIYDSQMAKLYKDFELYNKLNTTGEFPINQDDVMLCAEWDSSAGTPLNETYFVQDLWGAGKVFEAMPEKHYDIGSRVDYFIAHLLSFKMPTVLIDIRPLETYGTEYLSFIQADATSLDGIGSGSVESLSALCSIEHFGLGRYGDPIDPFAHLKAFESVQRVLAKGGNAYISLPVGPTNRLQFNAHRIYFPGYVIECFKHCELLEFSLCTEKGLLRNAPLQLDSIYMAGLFHFKKK